MLLQFPQPLHRLVLELHNLHPLPQLDLPSVLSAQKQLQIWSLWVSREHKSSLLCVPPSSMPTVLLNIF